MGNKSMIVIIFIYVIWNIITFFLYGLDKLKGMKRTWRVKESTLLLSAFLFGAAGSISGSLIFRHKTKKLKFKILLPLALIINIIGVFLIYYYIEQGGK